MGSNDHFHSRAAADLIRRLGRPQERPAVRWTPADAARVLARVQPEPGTGPGDDSRERSRIAAAFLAGVAQAHEEAHARPGASYAALA
ncbi:MAG TPA: hypothetical protein VIP05_05080, partial [Burkholderiaceae bacterium]